MDATDVERGYASARPEVVGLVPPTARNILELGCSAGALGAAIKRRQKAHVVGVEIDPGYAKLARERLDRVVVADAEEFAAGPTPAEAPFDCLICADLLEHLVDPWTTLARCIAHLSPGGTVIVSLPNVIYAPALLRLVRERRWPRDPQGIFDATHLRWFTLRDALELLCEAGLEPVTVLPNYFSLGWKLRVKRGIARLRPLAPYLAGQYVIAARAAD